jgi:hypothetical protein
MKAMVCTKEDFTKNDQTYDIIFDAVMKSSFSLWNIISEPDKLVLLADPAGGTLC